MPHPAHAATILLALSLSVSAMAQHQFDLSKANWAGKAHTGSSAILAEPPSFDAGGALILQGDNFIDVPGTRVAELPSEAFTIEAEVAIERGTKWGNIVGYMQDNGAYERGFSLGYNESSFTVWISTGGRAIFAIADTPYVPGQWYEVAASYDGRRLVLSIDGEVAASTDASGAIAYPDVAQLTIGAYRDQDEFYPMQGKLRTVKIRDKAMAIVPGASGLTVRPSVQFLTPGSAKIAWGAEPPGATLAIGTSKPPGETITATENEFTVEGLAPRTIYYYKINGGKTHSFNTALNFTPPPIPQSAPSDVLEMTDLRKGYCVIFGADAPLAEEIASNSDFTVIGIDTDRAAVAAARRSLYEKSIYGTRISMMHIESFDRLPFTDGIANLVVADRANPEIERISASGRSTVIIGGEARDSSRPAASKDWSHQYGEPGNSANGGDSLGGVRNTSELGVRWFGRPGADFGLDRQSRMPAPLSVAGRLFHQGMDRLAALDANNGSVLWGLEVPDMRRLNMPRDASNWCADQDHLYLAVKERAWIIDAERGTIGTTLPLPPGLADLEWGYIAREGDRLFGSSVRPESGYTSFWTSRSWFDGKAGSYGTGKVCSESLFAYSTETLELAWTYKSGLIINPTLAVKAGRVFFIESRNPKLTGEASRQITSPELWKDQFLVALDAGSGELLWEKSISLEDGHVSFYLQATEDTVLITSSNTQFHFYAFSTKDGQPIWNRSNRWAADHHSGHIQHPVILDGTVYVSPNGYSLADGEIVTTNVGLREGCHTYIGAGSTLVYRGQSRRVTMWDRDSESISSWPRLRPSCWLSFIPANGMLLLPEGGGGCSCGGWMETSIGFAPRPRP